ncbi:MAG: glycosyltransferase family 9 protein [Candidatus Hydrogenedentota bacterium]
MSESSNRPASFLIVRLGAIGDVLRVCPAVQRLRRTYPDARIGWAVEHWVAPLVEANPNVDVVHVLDRRELRKGKLAAIREFRRHVKEIRAVRYDVALDFHGRLKSGLITRMSGAQRRLGYPKDQCTELNHWFTNEHVRLEDGLENRVQRFLHLLGPLDADTTFDYDEVGLPLTDDARAYGIKTYEDLGSPPLAVYAGTSAHQAAYHRWPAEKWIELLHRLNDEGIASVVLWGPDEHEFSEQIVKAAGGLTQLAPPTTLSEMMGLLGQFKAFIGGNTASMHMAWLQQVPTALFTGPALPRTDSPMPPLPCHALRKDSLVRDGVSKRHQSDVTSAVSVDDAHAAVHDLLQSR